MLLTPDNVNASLAPFASQIVDADVAMAGVALARQKRMAEAERRIKRKWIEGVGEIIASFDSEVWHRLAAFYGYDAMRNDPELLKALLRDNPELRVKCYSPKTTLRVNGFKSQGGEMETRQAHYLKIPGSIPGPVTSGGSA